MRLLTGRRSRALRIGVIEIDNFDAPYWRAAWKYNHDAEPYEEFEGRWTAVLEWARSRPAREMRAWTEEHGWMAM